MYSSSSRVSSRIILFCFFLTVLGCETPSDEAEILSYVLNMEQVGVDLESNGGNIHIEFPEHITSAPDLVAEFELSEGATALVKDLAQISGQSPNNFEIPFSYEILAEDELTIKWWKVSSSNNSYTASWGMGGFQKPPVFNNREYEWYMDQANTGTHSYNNCGPTTTVMASLWSDPDHPDTPADARSRYRSEGGWWYTNDIVSYLDDYNIPNYIVQLGTSSTSSAGILKGELEQGSIALLCLDMYFVEYQSMDEYRTNKFYRTDSQEWGHFMLIKGYREVDGELYWETYDSNNWWMTYKDGTAKGKDRYYHFAEIQEATSAWWNYAIIVSEKGMKKDSPAALDIADIPAASGR
jgi:hypothetical protein